MDELTSRAEPDNAEVARAIDLADEFGMSVVLVRLRVDAEPGLAQLLLAEAELETAESLMGQEWVLWRREMGERAAFIVLDGAPRSLKRALVELEGSHDLGEAWNLDLVTGMDEGPDVWHASPERPSQRPSIGVAANELIRGYDWSRGNPALGG